MTDDKMDGALAVVMDVDRAITAAGGHIPTLKALDVLATHVQRYGQSHQQRIVGSQAKLKVAREGGRILVAMAERGERHDGRRGPVEFQSGTPPPTLATLGLTKQRSHRWQAVYKMPTDAFEARLDAIEHEDEDDSLVVQLVGGTKASTTVEWYTPARYVEAARQVMGGIDLDPASSEMANRTVKAATYYDVDFNGLRDEAVWSGRVWLNPPYGKGSGLFATRLVEEHNAGRVDQAVLLLNAYGFDAEWFQPLWEHVICFTDHRVVFTSPQRETGGPANGNIFVYLGPNQPLFAEVFGAFGTIVRRWEA